ncbi:MAG TPA: hypothetical protein VKZ50_17995 [bacterium]|nr:hypothetical protein [bacterium]
MTAESAKALDELRQPITDQIRAICEKDLDRLMNHYDGLLRQKVLLEQIMEIPNYTVVVRQRG